MKIQIFAILLLLLPLPLVFAQVTDTQSTLGVKLTNTAPFVYKDEEGYTVVIGELENTKSLPINNVKVWVGFYSNKATGSFEVPLETVTGNSLLDVIPPKGKSPFIIKSNTPNPEISEVTMKVVGFNAAKQKQLQLDIEPGSLVIGETIKLGAKIINTGSNTIQKISVHLIGYDAFIPPRIVGIQTVSLDQIESGKSQNISFDAVMNNKASSFKVIAESADSQSKMISVNDVSLESPTRLITINDVEVTDNADRISKIKLGQSVDIVSHLSIFSSSKNPKQDYVYYAQVRQFGEKSQVEFIGFTEGKFESIEPQTATISWTPQNEGSFFIETYVWDPNSVALAAPSKTISIILVTP